MLDLRLGQLEAEGVQFRTGVEVGVDVAVDELRAEFDAAVTEVEAAAAPGAEAIFDHVYARAPGRLDAQRAAASREAG